MVPRHHFHKNLSLNSIITQSKKLSSRDLTRKGSDKEIVLNYKTSCTVRGHDHLTSEYRGCAHNVCNINYNYDTYKIPTFFHNLKKNTMPI